jgi:cytosine/adenosine deaminase-related metal-dependent hydrolase
VHVGNGDFGKPYKAIEKMHSAGLMGVDIQYVHGNSLDDESIQRIAESGGQMVATPTVEMQMQFGYPASTRFLAAGVRPGLGVDVVTSTDCGLFAQMATTFQIARLQAYERGTMNINVRDALSFGTIDAARSVGLESIVGSLTPGKQADVVLLRAPRLLAANDPIAYVVLSAGTQSVDTVVVAGEIRKRDGRLLRTDVDVLERKLESSRARLLEAAQIESPAAALA